MKGRLSYSVEDGHRLKPLELTVCDPEDQRASLSETRRKRIMRLLKEAKEQGCLLSYRDLNLIFLSSLATLKRDISFLRRQGTEIFIRNGMRSLRAQAGPQPGDCGESN